MAHFEFWALGSLNLHYRKFEKAGKLTLKNAEGSGY
jgi:hypothetical protein